VLKALALAPLAAAGCAAAEAERAGSGDAPARSEDVRRGGASGAAALGAIRAHPLPPEAEPAFVFRAAAARPGDAR
jgi:hypothetical protein